MSSYSEGQTHQLMEALQSAGFAAADITLLGQYPQLSDIKLVIRRKAQIVITKHVVDCDASPFLPQGWKVEDHQKGGQLEWNPSMVSLYLSEKQKTGVIGGKELRKELECQPVLNANVLDYLLANPNLIPEEWKGKFVFFWGTISRDGFGNLYVRYLGWDGEQWYWRCKYLVSYFAASDPAAVCASNSR